MLPPEHLILPELRTPRLVLRHPRPSDAAAIFAIFGDPEAMRYWSDEPFREIDQAKNYLASIDQGFAERSLFQWAITESHDDALIGTVTLCRFSTRNRRAEVGYMLAPWRWGRGLAGEAVHRVLTLAFDDLDLHRIEADLDPRNLASARLLQRLGFCLEGLLRQRWFTYGAFSDSEMYGLLRGELQKPLSRPDSP